MAHGEARLCWGFTALVFRRRLVNGSELSRNQNFERVPVRHLCVPDGWPHFHVPRMKIRS